MKRRDILSLIGSVAAAGLPMLWILLCASIGTAVSSSAATSESSLQREYTGTIPGLSARETAIGISTDGQNVLAYICNGTPSRNPTIEQWFQGQRAGDIFDVTADSGVHLNVLLGATGATGTVTLKDGKSYQFTATPAGPSGKGGLYRAEGTFRGVDYIGGWVIFDRPEQKVGVPVIAPRGLQLAQLAGLINKTAGRLLSAPLANLITLAATLPGVGTFHLRPCRAAQCN